MDKVRKLIEIAREWTRVAEASEARAARERTPYARETLAMRAAELRSAALSLGDKAAPIARQMDEPQIDAIATATRDAHQAVTHVAFAGGAIEILVDLIQLGASLLAMKQHPVEAWLDEIVADIRRYGLISSVD